MKRDHTAEREKIGVCTKTIDRNLDRTAKQLMNEEENDRIIKQRVKKKEKEIEYLREEG